MVLIINIGRRVPKSWFRRTTKKIGAILVSKNGFALDTVAETIIGYKPEDLPIPIEARSRGILGNTLKEVDIRGDPLNKLIVPYKKPGTISTGVMKRFHGWFMRRTKQKLNPDICIKCGVCAKCCPVQAITLAQILGEIGSLTGAG